MAYEIKKLTVITKETKIFEVGINGVTEIRDNSIEAEQNTVLNIEVFIDKKLKHSFLNGTYEIEYF